MQGRQVSNISNNYSIFRAPDHSTLDKVRKWECPKTGLEVLCFLGLCNYYRKFIPEFADIAYPLYKVSNENSVIPTDILLDSFNQLNEALWRP